MLCCVKTRKPCVILLLTTSWTDKGSFFQIHSSLGHHLDKFCTGELFSPEQVCIYVVYRIAQSSCTESHEVLVQITSCLYSDANTADLFAFLARIIVNLFEVLLLYTDNCSCVQTFAALCFFQYSLLWRCFLYCKDLYRFIKAFIILYRHRLTCTTAPHKPLCCCKVQRVSVQTVVFSYGLWILLFKTVHGCRDIC